MSSQNNYSFLHGKPINKSLIESEFQTNLLTKSEHLATGISEKVALSEFNMIELENLCSIWQYEEKPGEWTNYPDDTNILLNIKHFNYLMGGQNKGNFAKVEIFKDVVVDFEQNIEESIDYFVDQDNGG